MEGRNGCLEFSNNPNRVWEKSYIKNCYFDRSHDPDGIIFAETDDDGKLYVYLDGYAIVPKDKYLKLLDNGNTTS